MILYRIKLVAWIAALAFVPIAVWGEGVKHPELQNDESMDVQKEELEIDGFKDEEKQELQIDGDEGAKKQELQIDGDIDMMEQEFKIFGGAEVKERELWWGSGNYHKPVAKPTSYYKDGGYYGGGHGPTRHPIWNHVPSHPASKPTRHPVRKPTWNKPTWKKPWKKPTDHPVHYYYDHKPTRHPTRHPSHPTRHPTKYPTKYPTHPTRHPTPRHPTRHPTKYPTRHPTHPTRKPTYPVHKPTRHPIRHPTRHPVSPTHKPVSCDRTIAELACGGSYSQFCKAIRDVGLYHRLDDVHEHFTAFFPSNDAFSDLLDHLHVNDVRDIPSRTLEEIVLLHLKAGRVIYKQDLLHRCSDLLTMANGDQTRTICKNDKREIYQKGSGNPDNDKPRIIKFDRETCNGVAHTIDEVMLPRRLGPQESTSCDNITEKVCKDKDFDILCEALHYTGLDNELEAGSWTVFGPTDKAFQEMLDAQHLHSVKDLEKEKVRELLLYHTVYNKELLVRDLHCNGNLKMTSGETSKTTCNKNVHHTFQVGTCNKKEDENIPRIIENDIKACNGYIQVVEDVLLPGFFCEVDSEPAPTPKPTNSPTTRIPPNAFNCDDFRSLDSIAGLACGEPNLSILCGAVQAAGLDDELDSNGTYTVFAPTNEAFEMLGSTTLEKLLADPSGELLKVILYHAADKIYKSSDLVCGFELETLVGSSNKFDPEGSTTVCNAGKKFQIGNGNMFGVWPEIIDPDIETCNGVVHIVDNVLVPKPDDAA